MVKNKLKEEYDLPTNLEALNKWTIPRIEPSLIYKLGTFEKIGLKQVVKTTEETIPLNSDELTGYTVPGYNTGDFITVFAKG